MASQFRAGRDGAGFSIRASYVPTSARRRSDVLKSAPTSVRAASGKNESTVLSARPKRKSNRWNVPNVNVNLG